MLNSVKYQSERSEGIPCGRIDCHYYEDDYDQKCSKENAIGDPGPAFCNDYFPELKSED